MPQGHEQRREDRDRRQVSGAGDGDPVQNAGEVLFGRLAGSDAWDEPTLLTDDVRLLVRVERDVDIEEREQQDQQRRTRPRKRGWSG